MLAAQHLQTETATLTAGQAASQKAAQVKARYETASKSLLLLNQWFFVRPAIGAAMGVVIGVAIGNFFGWC